MTDLSIRRATVKDAETLARVHVDAWRLAYRGLVPASRLDRLDYERRTARFREQLGGHGIEAAPCQGETYVAEREGEILGFVTLGPCRDSDVDPRQVGEIWGIYLAPQQWRQGAGTRLCRFAERLLGSRWYEEIKLWVLAGNSRARRFYEAMGFAADRASKMLDLGAPLETVRYGKRRDEMELTPGEYTYSVHVCDNPQAIAATEEDLEVLLDGLGRNILKHLGPIELGRSLRVFVRNVAGKTVAGATGELFGGWLYVSLLWVEESLRGRGYGTQLMNRLEEQAARLGCRHAHVDTYSFEARPFYERRGYELFATLEGYPEGHCKYFLKKVLAGPCGQA